MADLVLRIRTCFDKCLFVEETRLELSQSQEHLYACYPKCVEAADITEYITETLTQFLVMWRRALDVFKDFLIPGKIKNTGDSQVILSAIWKRDTIKVAQDTGQLMYIRGREVTYCTQLIRQLGEKCIVHKYSKAITFTHKY